MSAKQQEKEIKTDWSLKELSETERSNLLGFFALLLKVDRRVNPHLYANNGSTNRANQAE
tara:strand:+ start:397 stop:576 length:180 start_codon:yes stop_codon:yes gene_type:complete